MTPPTEAPWTERKLTRVEGGWPGRPLAETRWVLEAARLLADPLMLGRGVPHGDGRTVLVLPGFLAGDSSLAALRTWLRVVNYEPHVCGFRFNVDCSDRVLDSVERHAEAAAATSGRRVAVVGPRRASARAAPARSCRTSTAPSRSTGAPHEHLLARRRCRALAARARRRGHDRRGHRQPRRDDGQPQVYRALADALAAPELPVAHA